MWRHNWRRFTSIALITALGVAVLTGIYAGCRDMFAGANRFYDSQQLYDLQIVSTLGLDQDDVTALRGVSGVSAVQAERSATGAVSFAGADQSVTLREIGASGLNMPYVQSGTMPNRAGEVAVTQKFISDSGHHVGDAITVTLNTTARAGDAADEPGNASTDIAQTSEARFPTRLTITAVVLDPQDLSNPDGYQSGAFRSSATSDYTLFMPSAGVTGSIYTAISLRVEGAGGQDSFAASYADTVGRVADRIESTVRSDRQQARRQRLIDDARQGIEQSRDDAERRFAAAQSSLDADSRAFATQLVSLGATTAATQERLIASRPDLQQAKQRIDNAQTTLNQSKASAQAELAQEEAGLDASIPAARWYVNTRTSTGSFSNFKSDIGSIEALGRAFPIVFLAVAVLMSLTTMTRMAEEERGLIGTYVGLGYGRLAIAMRYVLFAAAACLMGGILGDVAGFVGIPAFLLVILQGLYVVPGITLHFDWVYGLGGIALFVVGVVAATAIACWGEMRQTPAMLMRPKSPRPGSRVLLERIRPVWRRMRFLNKVTVRNLFRFKGRLLMTVGGVAGCTALIVCGLAINDTVNALGPQQYGGVYRYDLLVVGTDADDLRSRLQSDGTTREMMDARVENGEIATDDASQSQTIQLVVIPPGAKLDDMVALRNAATGSDGLSLGDSGIIVAQSVAHSLGVRAGTGVTVSNGDAQRATASVAAVNRNLIGSDVYISADYYHTLFGAGNTAAGAESGGDSSSGSGSVAWNAIFAKLNGSDDEQVAYAKRLARDPAVISATSTVALQRSFRFDLMSAVVSLIVALAGGLALLVLFTLSSTNISERVREMATLKVLGFYDREVHRYANREMLALTLMGIAAGLPAGRYIGGLLTSALNMPSLYFEVRVTPWSYLIAAAVTMVFALLVQCFTIPVLDRIDPVSSLKSVE